MDLLERARCLMACPLFEGLAPAVLIRLAERARVARLERGERRTTNDAVWIVASGSLAVAAAGRGPTDATASVVRRRGTAAIAGNALGAIRIVRPETPAVEVVAEVPSALVGLAADDVRDILEADPAALAAIADRLAAQLLDDRP